MKLTIEEMHRLQKELYEAYSGDWEPLGSGQGLSSFLWMIGEAGEVIEIIKKEGVDAILNDPEVHKDFVEEICDVLMYLTNTMICYDVSPQELAETFREKQKRNLRRWQK